VLSVRGAVQKSAVLGHTRSKMSIRGKTFNRSSISLPVTRMSFRPESRSLWRAASVSSRTVHRWLRSVEITGQDKIAHGSIHSSNAERRNERATYDTRRFNGKRAEKAG